MEAKKWSWPGLVSWPDHVNLCSSGRARQATGMTVAHASKYFQNSHLNLSTGLVLSNWLILFPKWNWSISFTVLIFLSEFLQGIVCAWLDMYFTLHQLHIETHVIASRCHLVWHFTNAQMLLCTKGANLRWLKELLCCFCAKLSTLNWKLE